MWGIDRLCFRASRHSRFICEMFSGVRDASRHTMESHAEDMMSAERAGVIYNKKS